MIGWDDPHNAELYDRFARDHALYRNTSLDLVELAQLEDSTLVVDLACGTGITTEAILNCVPQSANVIALDASEAMLAIARRRVTDQRVRWIRALAVDLAQHATEADAVVCNSSIWQLDMEPAFAAVAKTLRAGVGSFSTLPANSYSCPRSSVQPNPPSPR